jgi:hypothetical protein
VPEAEPEADPPGPEDKRDEGNHGAVQLEPQGARDDATLERTRQRRIPLTSTCPESCRKPSIVAREVT